MGLSGEDYAAAKYYDVDDEYLIEMSPTFATSRPTERFPNGLQKHSCVWLRVCVFLGRSFEFPLP